MIFKFIESFFFVLRENNTGILNCMTNTKRDRLISIIIGYNKLKSGFTCMYYLLIIVLLN